MVIDLIKNRQISLTSISKDISPCLKHSSSCGDPVSQFVVIICSAPQGLVSPQEVVSPQQVPVLLLHTSGDTAPHNLMKKVSGSGPLMVLKQMNYIFFLVENLVLLKVFFLNLHNLKAIFVLPPHQPKKVLVPCNIIIYLHTNKYTNSIKNVHRSLPPLPPFMNTSLPHSSSTLFMSYYIVLKLPFAI